jgi:hypothetical protein
VKEHADWGKSCVQEHYAKGTPVSGLLLTSGYPNHVDQHILHRSTFKPPDSLIQAVIEFAAHEDGDVLTLRDVLAQIEVCCASAICSPCVHLCLRWNRVQGLQLIGSWRT